MRLSDIIKHTKKFFEKKRKNPIQLENDSNLESNLKFLKVSDKSTPLQISDDTINIQGSLTVNGDSVQTGTDAGATALDELSDVTYSSGDLTINSLDKIIADDFVVDSGASISLDSHSGNFIAKKAGTEFSVANSAYAGMILGYTSIQNLDDDTDDNKITIGSSFAVIETVAGTKANVSFVAPPSGNVEIVFSALCYSSSKTFYFSLSDNATYNELNEIHTYDSFGHRPDETDYNYVTIRWTITGLTAGTSYQYWIGVKCSSASGYIYHGEADRWGQHTAPIIVKAVALPATIVTGE